MLSTDGDKVSERDPDLLLASFWAKRDEKRRRRVEGRRKDASSLGHDGKDAASSSGCCLLLGPFSVSNVQVVVRNVEKAARLAVVVIL